MSSKDKKHIKVYESAYSNATNNELAAYVIQLSNTLSYYNSNNKKKEADAISKDIDEVKAEIKNRHNKQSKSNQ